MKKTFKFMMMVLAAIVMSASFAACSSSDDDNNTPTPGGDEKQPDEATLTFDFDISDDVLSVFDMTVTYPDENGKELTEAVTTTSFNKRIEYKKVVPRSIKYVVNLKAKENYPDKEHYDMKLYNHSSTIIYINGKNNIQENPGEIFYNLVMKDKLANFIEKYGKSYTYELIYK